MTAQDILDNARALIDELNIDGVRISADDTDIKAMEFNGILFLNQALREIYKNAQNIGEYEIDNTGADTDNIYTVFELPDNFGSIDDIINLTLYQTLEYKLVGYNKLYVNNSYLGIANVIYNKIPEVITLVTDTVSLPNPLAYEFVNNFVAARIAITENPDYVNYFEGKAEELYQEAKSISPTEEEIIDSYY